MLPPQYPEFPDLEKDNAPALPSWLDEPAADDGLGFEALPMPEPSALIQTPMPLQAASRLSRPTPVPETVSAPPPDGHRVFPAIASVNDAGDSIRLLVVVRCDEARGWANCRLKTVRIPNVRKLRCNRVPVVESESLRWDLGVMRFGQSHVVNVSVPRESASEFLMSSVWPFDFTFEPLPPAELTTTLRWPDIVPANDPFEITVLVSNSGIASVSRLTAKAVRVSAGDTVYESNTIALGEQESSTLTIRVPQAQAGSQTYRIWLDADGRMRPSEMVDIQGVLPTITVSIESSGRCELDKTELAKITLKNDGHYSVHDVALTAETSEEFECVDRDIESVRRLEPGEQESRVLRCRGRSPGPGELRVTVSYPGGVDSLTTHDLTCTIPETATNALDDLMSYFRQDVSNVLPERPMNDRRETGERHILYTLGESAYAVPLSTVREVMREPVVTRVPGTSDWIAGITNVRGEIVTVVDLPGYLELPNRTNARRAMMLHPTPDGTIGFLVDDVSGIRRFDSHPLDAELHEAETTITNYLSGMAELNDRIVPVLNFRTIADRMSAHS